MKTIYLILFFSIPSLGQNVYYVDHLQTDNSANGLSWNMAFKDLQHAIDQAISGDQIWVAKGTYLPTSYIPGSAGANTRERSFFLNKNLQIYGGFSGTETHINQRNIQLNPTILSADFNNDDNLHGDLDSLILAGYHDNAYHVLVTSLLPSTAEINGFTIESGNAAGEDYIQDGTKRYYRGLGGGVFNWESKALFKNCTFYKNRAINDGGAVYDKNCIGIRYDSCTFENNYAYFKKYESEVQSSANEYIKIDLYDSYSCHGGAIYHSVGNWSVSNSTFKNNHAAAIISFSAHVSSVLSNYGLEESAEASTEAQTSAEGGAIYANSALSTFINNFFEENSAHSETRVSSKSILEANGGTDGEAISNTEGSASSNGGAISLFNPSKTLISQNIFKQNEAYAKASGYSFANNDTYTGSTYYPDSDGLISSLADAGAISVNGNAGIKIERCFFYKNRSFSSSGQNSYILNSGNEPASVDADAQSFATNGALGLYNSGADTVSIQYSVF